MLLISISWASQYLCFFYVCTILIESHLCRSRMSLDLSDTLLSIKYHQQNVPACYRVHHLLLYCEHFWLNIEDVPLQCIYWIAVIIDHILVLLTFLVLLQSFLFQLTQLVSCEVCRLSFGLCDQFLDFGKY